VRRATNKLPLEPFDHGRLAPKLKVSACFTHVSAPRSLLYSVEPAFYLHKHEGELSLPLKLLDCIWQQGYIASTLNRICEQALVLRTITRDTTWQYLSAFGNKAAQLVDFFVINGYGLIDAKITYSLSRLP